MKIGKICIVLLMMLAWVADSSAATLWTGATNSLLDVAGNWTNGLPDNAGNNGIVNAGGHVTYDNVVSNNPVAANNKTIIFNGDSTLTYSPTTPPKNYTWINGNITLNDTAKWDSAGKNIIMDGSSLTLNGSSMVTNLATFRVGSGSSDDTVNQSGGSFYCNQFRSSSNRTGIYNLSAGLLAANDLRLDSGSGLVYINFTTGSTGALYLKDEGGNYATHIASGFIRLNDAITTVGSFNISGDTITLSGAPAETHWTGAVDSQVEVAGNWDSGLPTNGFPGIVSGSSILSYSTTNALALQELGLNDSASMSGGVARVANSTLTLNDSSAWTATGEVELGSSVGASTLSLTGNSQFTGTVLRVGSAFGGMVDHDGGDVVLSGALSLENSGSDYSLLAGTVSASDLSLSTGNGKVDFADEAGTASISIKTNGTAFAAAGGFEGYINSGLITIRGIIASTNDFAVNTVADEAVLTIAPIDPGALVSGVPNIIIFLADDMGQGDTSAYQSHTGNSNSEQIWTPAMEELASRGIRFTDGHSVASVCRPTRIGLLRGGRPMQLPEEVGPTMPSMLKRAGYRTYGVGKWHIHFTPGADRLYATPIVECPLDYGYDSYTGTEDNISKSKAFIIDRHHYEYDDSTNGLAALVPNTYPNGPGYENPGGPIENICQQIWIDAARQYMDGHAPGGGYTNKPFFLYYPSHANHADFKPADFVDGVQVENNCRTVDGQLLTGPRNGLGKPRSEMVWENDVAVSLLLDWLDNTDDPRNPGQKMVENTLFIFTSDNGANVNEGAPGVGVLRGRKTYIWEGGHRTPFMMSWPGRIPSNTWSSAQISLMDMFATFATIVGEPLAADEAPDSFSMLDSMLDPTITKDRPLGVYVAEKLNKKINMMRVDDYKIVWTNAEDLVRPLTFTDMYHLGSDISETTNLLDDPAYADVQSNMIALVDVLVDDERTRPPEESAESWIAANTTLKGEYAAWLVDADGDGHYNLEEFALGAAPDDGGDVPDGIKSEPMGTNAYPILSYRRRLDYASKKLTYTLLKKDDLTDSVWESDSFISAGSPAPTGDGLTEWVPVSYTNDPSTNLFIRLRIDVP
jgi:arylsulfatase A-like enzyme